MVFVAIAVCLGLSCSRAGAVPTHTETWAYDDSASAGQCNGGLGASTTIVRNWLTYAETNCGSWSVGGTPKAMTDCHSGGVTYCKVMPYADTNWVYTASAPSGLLSAASASWFLHEPAPNQTTPVTTTDYGGGYLMNQNTTAYQTWWKNYINANYSGADGLFMDDQSPYYPFFDDGSSFGTYEITTAAQVQAEHAAMSGALKTSGGTAYPQVDNTLPDCGNPYENQQGIGPTGNMLTSPVIGLLAEGCPEDNGTLTAFYPSLLDDMAEITSATSGFTTLLPYGQSTDSYEARSRRVTEATVLLGYSAGRVVVWPDLEQNNLDLAVWPEEGIYPTSPVQSMGTPSGTGCLTSASRVACPSGGHNDVQVAPGIYRREFRSCYNQGTLFGSCAAIVNDTGSAVTVQSSWLAQHYDWQITTTVPAGTSGDVQSGGTINTQGATFTAGTTTIPADDAVLLSGPVAPSTSPATLTDPATGNRWIDYRGANGLLWQLSNVSGSWSDTQPAACSEPVAPSTSPVQPAYSGSATTQSIYYVGADGTAWSCTETSGTWHNTHIGAGYQAVAPDTSLGAVQDASTGNTWLAYRGANGLVWQLADVSGSWTDTQPSACSESEAPMSTPTEATYSGSTTYQNIYYVGADNTVWLCTHGGSAWANGHIGGGYQAVATGTSLAVNYDWSSSDTSVAYRGTNGLLWDLSYVSSWSDTQPAACSEGVASTSTPALAAYSGNPTYQNIYYVGSDNTIWLCADGGGTWGNGHIGGGYESVLPGTSPADIHDWSTNDNWVDYVGADNGLWELGYKSGTWSNLSPGTEPVGNG